MEDETLKGLLQENIDIMEEVDAIFTVINLIQQNNNMLEELK